MRLEGRRESKNVDDRRGRTAKTAGLGIGGLMIAGSIALFMGGDPSSVLRQMASSNMQTTENTEYVPTAEEQELAKFASQILAGTEDVWTAEFKKMGRTYTPPKLVLFKGSVQSGCGGATSSTGPFYCSADQSVYLDLEFFSSMKQQLGADGDFAYAYVIAHEVGHHVEYLLGTLDKAHQRMQATNQANANKYSVRLELMADFYAGVWAHYENRRFGSISDKDLMEAIDCAQKIGDDYLQKRSQGYAVPESFTHGTSAQRMKWFKLGYQTGDVRRATTFQESDATL